MALAMDNPSYEGPQTQSKKFVGMESDDLPSTTFKDSGKLSKREKVLIILLVLILVVCIVFLVLFVQERNEDGDGPSVSGNKDNATGTQSPTTNMPTSSPPVSTAPPDFGPGPWENVRLPKHVRPVHYDVELVVDLEKLVFSGNVSVNVSVTNVSDYMFLHVNKLNISSPKLYNSVGTELTLTRHFRYKKNQFYVMEPDSRIEKGYYKIEMNFIGKLDDDLKGLYRSTYRNKDGKEITIATTQMQPTDARKAFPCFDEPAYKATFSITLVRARNLISITNMPRKHSKTRSNGMVADYYQKTVIMPTYLLAFVVCDFAYLETFAGSKNSSMKFYATKGQIDQAEFARNISGTVLEYFEQYFNISYPLPKADMIAIPDFAAGAMENWGLITYRETAILYKEGQSSESNKERITIVISHELAHMWFGNLVTPEWWDDLWLNEGFASYVEYLGVDKLFPEWLMKDMFVIQDLNYAFSLDALVTSHPILVPVNHPDEINEIFDSISYNKGASVIRMLQYFLGEDVFKSGLTNYLNAHSYGNAKTLDLWNALTEASRKAGKNIDVGKVMDTWTLQMGYPVVNVTADGRDIVLTQQRFLSDYSANQSSSKYTSQFGYTWNIPFTLEVRAANTSLEINTTKALPLIWMNRTADKTMVNGTSWDPARQWVKGNIGQTGYYRVNYPVENWKLLAQQLQHNHKVFSIGDRAGLIQDAFALADAKLLDFKYALDLTKYLDKEGDYIPWSAAYNSISSVIGILPRSRKVYRGLKEYRFKKMRPNLDRLGFVNTGGHLEKYLRVTAIFAACSVKNETCLRFTKAKFDAWIKNDTENRVSPDIRTAVYFYGMSQSGEEEWDIAFERFQKTNVASERRKLMFGLAGAPEPWLINRYLQYAFDPTKIKSQDTSYVISYVANSSPSGRHFAWNFLKEMWPVVLKRYGQGFGFSMNRFVNGVALGFSTKWELEELEKLFKKYPQTGSGTQARAQLLEKVRSNIQWRADNEKVIEDWLDALTN